MIDEFFVGPRSPFPQEVIDAMAKAIDNILTHPNIPPALAAKGEGMIPVGNWEETNDELRNEIADLEEEIKELHEEADELNRENNGLQDTVSGLTAKVNVVEDEIAECLFELDRLNGKNTELEEDIEGLLLLVEHWQNKAAEETAELARVKESYDELYEEFANTSRELSQIHGEVAPGRPGNTIDFVREMVNELGEVRHESAKAQLQVRELEQENNDLASDFANVVNANLELKKALRTLSE